MVSRQVVGIVTEQRIPSIALATPVLVSCGESGQSRCLDPEAALVERLKGAVSRGVQLQGIQVAENRNLDGGNDVDWIIAAWPESEHNTEPEFSSIAVRATSKSDGTSTIYSADAWSQLSTSFPAHDVGTISDLIDSNAINVPINCTLEQLNVG